MKRTNVRNRKLIMMFKVGDKVELLKNGAKNTYTSIADKKNRDEAQKQEGRIGEITGINNGIANVDTGRDCSYWWDLQYIELIDIQREQMIELENKL